MGNAATKEQRPAGAQHGAFDDRHQGSSRPNAGVAGPSSSDASRDPSSSLFSSRGGRNGRSELSSLLGLSREGERDVSSLEARRETRAERDARRRERERVNRERERARSMKEEHVDGGFLVTQGVYTGVEDYCKPKVRQFMIERRLAPFWRGLQDTSSTWTDYQLVSAARGLPLPAADATPPHDFFDPKAPRANDATVTPKHADSASKSHSSKSASNAASPITPNQPSKESSLFSSTPPGAASVLRGRAKTLTSLASSSRNTPPSEPRPQELRAPHDPRVGGQPIEVVLYRNATECPICFLAYPPFLNQTRCCLQAICSECFVQIKRPDPHPPEHPDANTTQPTAESVASSIADTLISEPSMCPYCCTPEFGVTYEPPPFRRGLIYDAPVPSSLASGTTSAPAATSTPSPETFGVDAPTGRRRGASLSVDAPEVVTTDRVRPDWANRLASARAHAARRSAAATALHTAAYMMSSRPGDSRFAFGRRALMRRGTGSDSPSEGASAGQMALLSLMTERPAGAAGDGESSDGVSGSDATGLGMASMTGPPRHSSRRHQVEDLEELMVLEAVRRSLATEEERRKKEEKESKKEAKRKAKEEKKAEKAARKGSLYSFSANQSCQTIDSASGSNVAADGKGKNIIRPNGASADQGGTISHSAPHFGTNSPDAQTHLERSRAQIMGSDVGPSSAGRPSHLRNLSSMTSSNSSMSSLVTDGRAETPTHMGAGIPLISSSEHFDDLAGTPDTSGGGSGGRGGDAGSEPLFNFRSLAAVIDREEQRTHSPVIEHADLRPNRDDALTAVPPTLDALSNSDTTQPSAADTPDVHDRIKDQVLSHSEAVEAATEAH